MTPNRLRQLGLERLDLLCGFLYYTLNEGTLGHAPMLLQGFRSIEKIPALSEHVLALRNLRRCCKGLTTQAAIRAAARRYNDQQLQRTGPSTLFFHINERTLAFKPVFDLLGDRLRTALEELQSPPTLRSHCLTPAARDKPMFIGVRYDDEYRRYEVKGIPFTLPPATQHSLSRVRAGEVQISWQALLEEALDMDRIDVALGAERAGNWEQRLRATTLASPSKDGTLDAQAAITLEGVKHLIGLPGAGKTTLLVCLLRHLARRDIKTAVFFPSIEVCRQYLEDLHRYGIKPGLLVGQSPDTRRTHAMKLAEALASEDELRGFARSTLAANLFEGTCALPGLTDAPEQAFSIESRFCRSVLQKSEHPGRDGKDRYQAHLCPAWSVCSANRAARELPDATVWLGHIRSADTQVPSHTTTADERYFEMIARQFDVVIFDEADKAQQDLDMSGISQLRLSGYQTSFHQQIQQHFLQLLASGSNARLRNLDYAEFMIECVEFEKLNIALVTAIHRLSDELRRDFEGLLLTPLRLIGDWLSPRKLSGLNRPLEYLDTNARAKDALCYIWESGAVAAFQSRGATLPNPAANNDEWRRAADAFEVPLPEVVKSADELKQHLSMWLNVTTTRARLDSEQKVASLLVPYLRGGDNTDTQMLVPLLIAATFTVLSYRRLAFRLQMLAQEGLAPSIRVDERCSDNLLLATPENLLGSLSGVRFFTTKRSDGSEDRLQDIQLQYIVFSGAPRALMYHLHEWNLDEQGKNNGPAVLLTSATSFLPSSPAYHIDVLPAYLLHRPDVSAPTSKSIYAFRPIEDRDSIQRQPLRFSGERSERTRIQNLQKMVTALLDGGPTNSLVARDCRNFDVRHGIARRAAFVVNSYEQSERLKQFIDQRFSAWRDRVIAVVQDIPANSGSHGYVTPGRVEALGDDPSWDILIFPMGALGRGTNVVFSEGGRRRDATLGSLYFLTRPHPSPEDLSLLVSIGAKATQDFNTRKLDNITKLETLGRVRSEARSALYGRVGRLLRHPLYARSLDEKLFEPFTANIAVPLLQTIGRAMRNGCPVQCFFVDRAWAERSSLGEEDDNRSSILVQLREILSKGINSPDAKEALLYRELYLPFLEPLKEISGLMAKNAEKYDETSESWGETPLLDDESPF